MADMGSSTAAERLRDRIVNSDEAVFGAWLGFASGEMLGALCASSIDYVGIDCQHGLVTETDVARLIVAAGPVRPARIVRVGANRPELIGKALDGGADGVIVPSVNSAEEARAAAAATSFPPDGVRSYGVMAAFVPRDPALIQRRALVLPMIETRAGLAAVEEILAVPGVDGVYVGPADLGIALGLGHAQFPAGPGLEASLEVVVAAARGAGKFAGIHAGGELFAAGYVEQGFRLITLGSERSFVSTGVDRALMVARAGHRALDRPIADPGHATASPY